ncbi:MAG: MarR family transcriptional regulator [Actinomycetia bacterium]|nr:MarR family transcriptional regulator [Actinomycetes bacterium]
MGFDELAVQLMDEMRSLHNIKPQQQINEAFRGEAFIIDYIANRQGDVLPSEIGQVMDVSSARVANALNNLEKKELITRRIDTEDRRCIVCELTKKGHQLAQQHHQMMQEVISKMLSSLGEDDAKEYVRIMSKLAKSLPGCEELKEC